MAKPDKYIIFDSSRDLGLDRAIKLQPGIDLSMRFFDRVEGGEIDQFLHRRYSINPKTLDKVRHYTKTLPPDYWPSYLVNPALVTRWPLSDGGFGSNYLAGGIAIGGEDWRLYANSDVKVTYGDFHHDDKKISSIRVNNKPLDFRGWYNNVVMVDQLALPPTRSEIYETFVNTPTTNKYKSSINFRELSDIDKEYFRLKTLANKTLSKNRLKNWDKIVTVPWQQSLELDEVQAELKRRDRRWIKSYKEINIDNVVMEGKQVVKPKTGESVEDFYKRITRALGQEREISKRADFSDSDLYRAKMSYSAFSHCDFMNSNLSSADFACSKLFNCDFSGANLMRATFSREDPASESADIRLSSILEDEISYDDWNKVCRPEINNCNFEKSQASTVNFTGATVTDCSFDQSNLFNSSFKNCHIFDTTFFGADLTRVNWGYAQHEDEYDTDDDLVQEAYDNRALFYGRPEDFFDTRTLSTLDISYSNTRPGFMYLHLPPTFPLGFRSKLRYKYMGDNKWELNKYKGTSRLRVTNKWGNVSSDVRPGDVIAQKVNSEIFYPTFTVSLHVRHDDVIEDAAKIARKEKIGLRPHYFIPESPLWANNPRNIRRDLILEEALRRSPDVHGSLMRDIRRSPRKLSRKRHKFSMPKLKSSPSKSEMEAMLKHLSKLHGVECVCKKGKFRVKSSRPRKRPSPKKVLGTNKKKLSIDEIRARNRVRALERDARERRMRYALRVRKAARELAEGRGISHLIDWTARRDRTEQFLSHVNSRLNSLRAENRDLDVLAGQFQSLWSEREETDDLAALLNNLGVSE